VLGCNPRTGMNCSGGYVMADSCRVMVVDDNRDAADSAVMLLQVWGHEAMAVYSGEHCLVRVKDFDPDVILMDIGLPGLDGFEVKEELEKICPGVRVVALTGYTQADIRRRARKEGFAGHLLKPVEGAELKSAVNDQCSIAKGL
jgi:CheY-like chemotaxis protein